MMFFAALLFLTQQLLTDDPPEPQSYSLSVQTLDRSGSVSANVTVVLMKVAQTEVETIVANKQTDAKGNVTFSDLGPGTYALVGGCGGCIKTRIGPVHLSGATTMPVPLRLMLNEYLVH